MSAVMIHHVGNGFKGSVTISQLDQVMTDYPKMRYTFDDGLKSQENALPLLKKHGIKAIFFLNNENKMEQHRAVRERMGKKFIKWFYVQANTQMYFPKEFLAEYDFYSDEDRAYRYFRDVTNPFLHDEIMDAEATDVEFIDPQLIIDEGHQIGLHTATHPNRLDLLRAGEQLKEWDDNLKHLSQFSKSIRYAAYPLGKFNEVTKFILGSCGITMAFTGLEHSRGQYELPRIDIKQLIT